MIKKIWEFIFGRDSIKYDDKARCGVCKYCDLSSPIRPSLDPDVRFDICRKYKDRHYRVHQNDYCDDFKEAERSGE